MTSVHIAHAFFFFWPRSSRAKWAALALRAAPALVRGAEPRYDFGVHVVLSALLLCACSASCAPSPAPLRAPDDAKPAWLRGEYARLDAAKQRGARELAAMRAAITDACGRSDVLGDMSARCRDALAGAGVVATLAALQAQAHEVAAREPTADEARGASASSLQGALLTLWADILAERVNLERATLELLQAPPLRDAAKAERQREPFERNPHCHPADCE